MKKRNTIITTVSITTALTCVCLTFWGNMRPSTTITIEAFFGIIATLIGVCATIVVGFQIASFIEVRDMKKQLDKIEEERKKIELIASNLKGTRSGLANAFAVIASETNNPLNNLAAKLMCIICEDITNLDSNITLQRYINLRNYLKSQPKNIQGAAYFFVDNLKTMVIPKDIENHIEIAKLHYEIISIIDTAYENSKTD